MTTKTDGLTTWSSIAAMKARADEVGNKWFSKGAMKFFNSKIETGVIAGKYFISSEKFETDPRRYTIRVAVGDAISFDVDSVGVFQQYGTINEARKDLDRFIHLEDES